MDRQGEARNADAAVLCYLELWDNEIGQSRHLDGSTLQLLRLLASSGEANNLVGDPAPYLKQTTKTCL